MTSICFVGPFQPILCGIADYTSFLAAQLPLGHWAALTFQLKWHEEASTDRYGVPIDNVWYGIPGHNDYSASLLQDGLRKLNYDHDDVVLWFQHEFAIWPDHQKFVSMLKDLKMPKVVTPHTLHYQSQETPCGLRQNERNFLNDILPFVDAITVFSRGVYSAVVSAFPEYYDRVYVMRHGIHTYPHIARMSRKEARDKLNDFLLYESDLEKQTKEALHRQCLLLDPRCTLIGQTGFLCQEKQSELLYLVRDKLQMAIPSKRIGAIRIGTLRDTAQRAYAEDLRQRQDHMDRFLLETWLPLDMLPIAQRALDINLYWPEDCTQSGIVAHALGARAVMVGRSMESTGEILQEAGTPTATDLQQLEEEIEALILHPELAIKIEEEALRYAAEFSWYKQALRHLELADKIAKKYTKYTRHGSVESTVPLFATLTSDTIGSTQIKTTLQSCAPPWRSHQHDTKML